jgi:hypothetical protein
MPTTKGNAAASVRRAKIAAATSVLHGVHVGLIGATRVVHNAMGRRRGRKVAHLSAARINDIVAARLAVAAVCRSRRAHRCPPRARRLIPECASSFCPSRTRLR